MGDGIHSLRPLSERIVNVIWGHTLHSMLPKIVPRIVSDLGGYRGVIHSTPTLCIVATPRVGVHNLGQSIEVLEQPVIARPTEIIRNIIPVDTTGNI